MQQPDIPAPASKAVDASSTFPGELSGQVIDQIATALLKAAAERHSTERRLLYKLKEAAAAGRAGEVLSIVSELSGEVPAPAA